MFQGLDFGHSAVQFTFPIEGNEDMVEKMRLEYGDDFAELFKRNEDQGTFTFYWSFWPDEEENKPHVLATLKEDIYWQRFGVPFDYDTREGSLGAEIGATAARRNATGLLGQRKPYKLGPELITQFPDNFNFEKAYALDPDFFTATIAKELQEKKRTLNKDELDKLNAAVKNNLKFLELDKKKDNLSPEEKETYDSLLARYGSKDQALGNILYFHQILHMNNIDLNNKNFKESRKFSRKDLKNPSSDKMREIDGSVERINGNIRLIEDTKNIISDIEQTIPDDIMRYITHGLAPERISFPVFANTEENRDRVGLNLEQALHAAGKMSRDKVPYTILGSYNCSSTSAAIIHDGLQNCDDIKRKFSPNKISPYAPQQFYNRAVLGQQKLHHSTLHGERSQSFIEWARSIKNSIVRKFKQAFNIEDKDQIPTPVVPEASTSGNDELKQILSNPSTNKELLEQKMAECYEVPLTQEALAFQEEMKKALTEPNYFESETKKSKGFFMSRPSLATDSAPGKKALIADMYAHEARKKIEAIMKPLYLDAANNQYEDQGNLPKEQKTHSAILQRQADAYEIYKSCKEVLGDSKPEWLSELNDYLNQPCARAAVGIANPDIKADFVSFQEKEQRQAASTTMKRQ